VTRDPKGHFISRDAMLGAWLPSMLDAQWSDQLQKLLNIAAKWCMSKAADCYGFAKNNMTDEYGSPDETKVFTARRYVAQAEKWFARREVLLRAAEELSKI